MREQSALAAILLPFGEIVGVAAVLARTVMLEPDPAKFVAEREQKFITVEMADAEQRDGFGHQRCVACDMVGARLQIFRFVGDDVQRHLVAEVPFAEIFPRKHRAVDEGLVIGRGKAVAARRYFEPVERRHAGPAFGQRHVELHRNIPREIARGIEADLFPLQVHHRRGDDDAALAGARRRQEIEADVDAGGARGHVDVKGVDVGRLARPGERLAARRGLETRHLGDRAARRVLAGQPFGIEQGELPGLRHRDRLPNVKDAARNVGRIDAQLHRPRIGFVGGQRDGQRLDDRLGAAARFLGMRGGGEGEERGCDERCFFHGLSFRQEMLSSTTFSPCGRRIRSLAAKRLGAVG